MSWQERRSTPLSPSEFRPLSLSAPHWLRPPRSRLLRGARAFREGVGLCDARIDVSRVIKAPPRSVFHRSRRRGGNEEARPSLAGKRKVGRVCAPEAVRRSGNLVRWRSWTWPVVSGKAEGSQSGRSWPTSAWAATERLPVCGRAAGVDWAAAYLSLSRRLRNRHTGSPTIHC